MNKTIASTLTLAALLLTACNNDVSDVNLDKNSVSYSDILPMTAPGSGDRTEGGTLFIDARSAADFNAGHIPGAANLSVMQVSGIKGATDPRLEQYKTLIVYGNDPGSANAKALAKRLMETGYKRVRYYPDGFAGWKASGGSVEVTPPATKTDSR